MDFQTLQYKVEHNFVKKNRSKQFAHIICNQQVFVIVQFSQHLEVSKYFTKDSYFSQNKLKIIRPHMIWNPCYFTDPNMHHNHDLSNCKQFKSKWCCISFDIQIRKIVKKFIYSLCLSYFLWHVVTLNKKKKDSRLVCYNCIA